MYLIVMVYFLAIAFLGYLGYKKTKDSKDFLIGGGEMNPIVMALSYGATFISASAIVGFGGVAATFGMGIQWLMFLNMFVGVVIAFIVILAVTTLVCDKAISLFIELVHAGVKAGA